MTAPKLPRELRMIYREIPASSPCKPGCSDCCGPVPWLSAELARVQNDIPLTAERIAFNGATVLMNPQTGTCPFVAKGGGCTVYDRRPFICRLFSSSVEAPMLRCPHGACPACPMSAAKASALTKRYHGFLPHSINHQPESPSMSRHTYTTAQNVTVTMGYDRPLDYIHCTVEKDGDVLYTNLDDENAGCPQQNVGYFRPILTKLGVEVPETIFKEVATDQLRRVGNRNVVHPTGLGFGE